MFEADIETNDGPLVRESTSHEIVTDDEVDLAAVIDRLDVESPFELPDDVFDALAAAPRRWIVKHLWEAERAVTVAELALIVASIRLGIPPSAVDPDQQQQSAIVVHHVHLPKLAACGLVEWNRSDNVVVI